MGTVVPIPIRPDESKIAESVKESEALHLGINVGVPAPPRAPDAQLPQVGALPALDFRHSPEEPTAVSSRESASE